MIKVLQMTEKLDYFGIESVIMNLYRNIDHNKIQFDFIVCEEKGRFDEEVLALGGKIFRLPKRARHPFAYSKALIQVIKENGGYDIFHCNTNSAGCFIDLRAAKKAGIVTRIEHSHNADCMLKLQHYLFKPFLKNVTTDKIACSKEAAIWMFGNENDCKIMPNGIDLDLFNYNENLRIEARKELNLENAFVIGHVGSFQDRKNQMLLVDAVSKSDVLNIKLVLVGDGETIKSVEDYAKSLGIADKVLFLGNRNDVNRLMNVFDVFAFPSKFEGLPVVCIEAQANGLPCVLSDQISVQTKITDLCEFLPIERGAQIWANAFVKLQNVSRKNECDEITKAGYNIKEQAQWLQNFYISKCSK